MKTITAVAAFALANLLSLFTPPTLSQSYPAKPIRFLVGFATGGANDIIARARRNGEETVVRHARYLGGH